MHLSDGILPVSLCLGGQALAMGAVVLSSRRLEAREIPRMGVFAAALFSVSLLHVPLGGTSIHPGFYGLVGLLLGKRSIPVIFVTLLFQSLIFQHGGLLSLGVNTLFIGCGALCGWFSWDKAPFSRQTKALIAGFFGVMTPALLVSATLTLLNYGRGMLFFTLIYLPAAVLEALVTLFIVRFFSRVQPGVLDR